MITTAPGGRMGVVGRPKGLTVACAIVLAMTSTPSLAARGDQGLGTMDAVVIVPLGA